MSDTNIDQLLSEDSTETAPEAVEVSTGDTEAAKKNSPAAARKKQVKGAAPAKSAAGNISWAQVGAIFAFVSRVNSADEADRTLISSIFQSTDIELAQAVMLPERMSGYRLAADLTKKSVTNSLTVRDGMRLTGEFAELDSEVLRFATHTVSVITGTTLRYRKDRNSFDVATEVLDALEKIEGRDDIIKQLTWVDETLTAWPGA